MDQSMIFRLHPKSSDIESCSLLLLANAGSSNESTRFCFSRYIYLNVDAEWNMLGINISNSILDKHADVGGQYLTGTDMLKVLVMYKDEIAMFCELYCSQFSKIFGLCPTDYFEFAAPVWAEHVNALE
ncbi:hypothetical protein L2735_10470 [Shewanella olleyana]|uniref:hypothetical protein n=1 Tax=Shewanella olleyana TaxID=135626 RepID=UPI00200EFB42|nr:hypothetical protein [Shewanella olleyana]MCL1067231.1 hypothetical protein [Shewanella olleyana]